MMPEENKVKKEVSSVLYKIKDTVLNFLVPLIAILGSLLLGILYILPSFKSLSTKRSELESKVALKNTLDDKVSYLKKLVDLKETLDENSEIVNKVLVSEPEVPRLLDQATQIAEKAGMAKAANIVILGIVVKATGAVKVESTKEAIKQTLGEAKAKYLPINLQVLDAGLNFDING